MKNILKLMPLLAVTLFFSCNNDDDNNKPASLVGTWKLTGYYNYTAETFTPVLECYNESTTFKTDGTATTVIADCDDGHDTFSYLWEKAENKNAYHFTYGDMITEELVIFENNNKITITFNSDNAREYVRMLAE